MKNPNMEPTKKELVEALRMVYEMWAIHGVTRLDERTLNTYRAVEKMIKLAKEAGL
jgi:hypothetical protein